MKSPDPFEWEISKENVVPRKGGRTVNELNLALANIGNVEYERQLMIKQKEFECQLRTNTGPDPLHIYCEYCSWMEEHFPTGPNSQLKTLYELSVNSFITDARYSNDSRYVNIWMNFIKICPEIPTKLEKFSLMFHYGIGTMHASLYLNWAYYLQQVGNVKRAIEVLEHGQMCRAQPMDKIKEKLQYIESEVCQSISDSDEKFDFFATGKSDISRPSTNTQTQALKSIRSTAEVSGSLNYRAGSSSTKSRNIGVLDSVTKGPRLQKPFTIPEFPITETASKSLLIREGRPTSAHHLANSYKKDQENADRIEKWHRNTLGTPSSTPGPFSASSFQVFSDTPSSSMNTERICLSSKKGLNFKTKEEIPNEVSDGVKYMFDIKMLYGGLQFFNFEQCKAAFMQSKNDNTH